MLSANGGLVGDSGPWQRKGGSAQSKVEGSSGVGGEQRLPTGRSHSSRVGGSGGEDHTGSFGESWAVSHWRGVHVRGREDGSRLVAEKGQNQEDQGWEQPLSSSPAHPLHRWETETYWGL